MTRRAFTTVELMVVLLVGGIVAATIGTVLRRQQRFFSNAATIVEHRVALRDATGILPAELRALSPGGGDLIAFSDSSLEIRATIGAAIACDTVSGGVAIDLTPARASRSPPLAAFATSPQRGDVAMVFDEGTADDTTDDAWVMREVESIAFPPNVCAGSPLLEAEDLGAPRLRLRFGSSLPLPTTVHPGAFVHVLRRVRYRLYRASTGDWYLGYSEWDGNEFGVIQPVSGPFASYSRRAANTGLLLRYFDINGLEVSSELDAARIARVEVVARADKMPALSGAPQSVGDAQAITVRPRNQ